MNFGYSNINKLFSGEITPGTGGLSEYEVKKLIQEKLKEVTADIDEKFTDVNSSISTIENSITSIESKNLSQDTSILGFEKDIEDISERVEKLENGSIDVGIDEEAVKEIINAELKEGGMIYTTVDDFYKTHEEVIYLEKYADLPEEGAIGTLYIVDETDTSYHWSPGLEELEGHYDPVASSVIAVNEEGEQEVIMPSTEKDIDNIFN